MTDSIIVLHVCVAAGLVIALILAGRLDPTISLILGSLYLGIAGGSGVTGTIESIAKGFGATMADLGLLIGFGTLLGSLLVATGALQWIVRSLLAVTGVRRFPYALGTTLSVVFPSVIPDVLFILAAPVVREAAKSGDERSLPRMATAMMAGGLVGLALVVPGVASVAIAGIFDVPLGTMLLYGFVLGPLTVLVTTLVGSQLNTRLWRPERDLERDLAVGDAGGSGSEATSGGTGTIVDAKTATTSRTRASAHLLVLASIFLPVGLMATGMILEVASVSSPPILTLLSSPVIALLTGVLVAYAFARRRLGRRGVDLVLGDAFGRAGNILLVTGAGGAFGTVIASTDIAKVLGGWFRTTGSTSTIAIILLAWGVAALAHLGVGSISIAAITAAGIVSPLIAATATPHVVVALAVGAGALFAVHINSNGFWLIRSLLGLTTSGALKIVTLTSALASTVALVLVLLLSTVV